MPLRARIAPADTFGPSYDLHVTFRARLGHGAELEWLLRDAVEQIGEVPSLELLVIERAASDPDVVRVTESWTSRAEHEEFAARPDVRALIAHVHALCKRPPEIVPRRSDVVIGMTPGADHGADTQM